MTRHEAASSLEIYRFMPPLHLHTTTTITICRAPCLLFYQNDNYEIPQSIHHVALSSARVTRRPHPGPAYKLQETHRLLEHKPSFLRAFPHPLPHRYRGLHHLPPLSDISNIVPTPISVHLHVPSFPPPAQRTPPSTPPTSETTTSASLTTRRAQCKARCPPSTSGDTFRPAYGEPTYASATISTPACLYITTHNRTPTAAQRRCARYKTDQLGRR